MSSNVERVEQWIRSNLEAFLRDAGFFELLEDLSQSHPQLYKSAQDLLSSVRHYNEDATPFGIVVLVMFLYVSGSVLWHWTSPSVRWAYRQYRHTSRRPPSSASGSGGGGGVGPLYLPYLIQNSVQAALRSWNRLVFSAAYHLPPDAVVLLLLAPYSRFYYSNDDSSFDAHAALKKDHDKNLNWAARYVLDELSRRCFQWVTTLVAISWLHEAFVRKWRLSDLPLPPEYRDLDRSLLPPFLPEDDDDADEESREAVYREAVMEYLVSLQEVRATSNAHAHAHRNGADPHHHPNHNPGPVLSTAGAAAGSEDDETTLGYAVVTGASRGIGRALAVELARYGFPLVLVARDRPKLLLLAKDLRDCYGTRCCVVAYDLAAAPDAAEQVYNVIVQKAGLKVDVLVNNAGIAHCGVSVDLPPDQVDRMVALNVQAVSALTHRFGKDMKDRGRGRIMIVSSLNSMAVGIRSVAVYTATKAFERSLCNSLSLDLEPFGVGVTCLVPGAVRDTDFRSRSRSEQALVWRLPFCTCTPQQVAAHGVRAMLRGEAEVIVGLLNRFFAKVLQPLLQQRLHNLVATIMWNPPYAEFLSSHPPSKVPQTKGVAVDPRLARACRESDVCILSAEGWQAERGWKTETGRFERSSPNDQAAPRPPSS